MVNGKSQLQCEKFASSQGRRPFHTHREANRPSNCLAHLRHNLLQWLDEIKHAERHPAPAAPAGRVKRHAVRSGRQPGGAAARLPRRPSPARPNWSSTVLMAGEQPGKRGALRRRRSLSATPAMCPAVKGCSWPLQGTLRLRHRLAKPAAYTSLNQVLLCPLPTFSSGAVRQLMIGPTGPLKLLLRNL